MQLIFITVFFFSVALVSSNSVDDSKAELKKIHEKCQADPKLTIDDGVFKKIMKGEKIEEPRLADHSLCMNVELGIQNQNGDVVVEKIKNFLQKQLVDENKIDEIIKRCGTRAPGSAGEAAIALAKCLFAHHQE